MAQKQSDTGADESPKATSPPYFTIETIRRPNEDGTFGTVSYKVAVSGGTPDEGIRVMKQLTQELETEYGEQKTNTSQQSNRR